MKYGVYWKHELIKAYNTKEDAIKYTKNILANEFDAIKVKVIK
jgi:hypothetical protein